MPFLWFDGKAEEAINFYASIFKNSKVTSIKHWGENSTFPSNQVMTGIVELDGIQFYAFDAGPVSNLLKRYPFMSIAKTSRRWIIFGKSCQKVARKACAGG